MEDYEVIEPADELVDPKQQMKEKRGKTLPVICILTMVNVGWMAISAIISLASGPMSDEEILEFEAQTMASVEEDTPEMALNILVDTIEYTKIQNEKIYEFAGISLALAAMGFFAAFLMYRLKKTGFIIYLAYCAAAVAVPLVMVPDNMITKMQAFIVGILSLVFIVLYAVQLKRMS